MSNYFSSRRFAEFFSGAGMARAGLGVHWDCVFANDIDEKKSESYRRNWGAECLHVGDVSQIPSELFPQALDLAWASFPCQDLSQAGAGAGLEGGRSGVFWPFWRLLQSQSKDALPRIVVLENVPGAITSHNGRDFIAISSALADAGYRFGALLLDAASFVPQSRLRLFFVAVLANADMPSELHSFKPSSHYHSKSLVAAVKQLPDMVAENWVWCNLPLPPVRKQKFGDILLSREDSVTWNTDAETRRILGMMADLHLKKISSVQQSNERVVGSIYKRRRCDGKGGRVQRAEVRFDHLAGCLRTPTGGSSRQTIIVVDSKGVRTRILQPREAARLMGLSDAYILPDNYYEAYHLVGDGVAVPVVRFLAANILEPYLDAQSQRCFRLQKAMHPQPKINRGRQLLKPTSQFC